MRLSRRLSDATKEKISKANLGQKRNPEVGQKISQANAGKTQTPETRRKISNSLRDYWSTIPE